MTTAPNDNERELNPEQERMVRRLKRIMLFSTAVMLVGFLGVFGVIAYRLSSLPERVAAPPELSVVLPKGAKVLSTAVSDGRIVVTIEREGAVEIRSYDLSTFAPRGTLKLAPE